MVVGTSSSAQPAKPLVMADDEMAVFANPESPDWKTVLDKYDGKVVKITGKLMYNNGGNKGISSFYIANPKVRGEDKGPWIYFYWSKNPATDDEAYKVRDSGDLLFSGTQRPALYAKIPTVAIYGRLTKKGLEDASKDPKIGGIVYVPPVKPLPKLKK